MTAQSTFSVLIPAYNEETGVAPTLNELLDAGLENTEIIVVDDGFVDSTAHVVGQVGPPVRVLQHRVNCGYGSAIVTGAYYAEGD